MNAVSTITTSSLRTTGNVGIGTTNPSSLLTVHGGNTSTAITVANGFNVANYSRYGLAYSASQYSNHSVAGDTVINSVGGNMILEAVNKNISLSVPNTVCPNLLTVSGTGSSQTSSTAGWGSLTNTFKYNSIALTWTAPVACYVSSVSMYLGQGNNGTNISMYVNGNFINEWWPFQGYGLYVINATGSSIANGSATTPTPFSAMGQTLLQPGQTLVIYVSTLQTYNYFYYGHDSTTGGIGFSVVYAVPKVDLSLSSSGPALSLGMTNVGVGTSAPLAVLDVNGSMRVLDKTYTALTSGTGVDIIYSGGGTLTSGTRGAGGALTAAAMSYAASGHTWYVGSSAGTNAMTIASSGRLGVGTATPRRVVDIVGPPTNPFTYAPTQLSISDTTGSALMNLLIGVDGTSNYASIQASQSGVGGRPLLLNASDGNVGIGTSNPAYPLDVYGGSTVLARLKHSSDYARFVLEGPSGGDLIFKVAGSSKWGVACIDNHLQFLLNDSTSTIPVVFTSSGSVGIGITNPFSKLNIAGGNIQLGSLAEYENGTTCTEVIQFGGGYAANWTYGYAGIQGGCAGAGGGGGYGGIMNFWTKVNNGSTYTGMTLNQGNVGIGTTTPSYALDVVGSSRVSGSILFGFGGTYAAGCIYTDSNWGCIIRAKTVNPAVGAFLFSNSADTHLMTITNSGFVGIGTDTPPSWGQTTICGAGNSVNSSNQLVLMNSTNNNMVLMLAMGTAAAYIQSYQQGTPGGATLCLNQLGGNVGIGLTNPSYLLHVAGSLNCSSLFVGGVAITSLGAQWTQSGSNAYYTTGSVGIGTTSPSNLLTVAQLGANYSAPVLVLDAGIAANASAGAPRGIGKPLLGIGNSSWTSGGAAGDYYGIGFGYGGATSGSFYPAEIGLYVQTTSGATQGDLVFSTRSTTANSVASERMRITGAGNVGIGTTNPSFPLSLVGAQSINGTSSQYSKTTSSGNLLFNTSSDSYAYPTMNLFNYDHNNNGIFFDIIYTNPNWQNCTTGTNWGIYKTGGSLQFTYLTGTAGTTGDLTNAMVLTSSGVGIGTTNPSGTLHAYGNAVVANYRPYVFSHFTVSRSAAAASMAIVAGTESTTATLYLGTPLAPGGSASSAYKVCILANGNGSGSGWSTADLHFCLNNSTGGSSNDFANTASISDSKMVIKTYGNVGIGTVDPSAKLHVAGATFIQGPTVGTTTTNVIGNFGLRISQLTSAQETVGQIVGQMCFHGWGRPNASSFIRCITDATNGYDDAGALVFGTSNSGTGAVETMRISETGYVGIGKTNPAYLLDVAGSFNCTGLYVNGAAFTGGSGATWSLSGSNAYYTAGNIGIGTASPAVRLHVFGNSTAGYLNRIQIEGNASDVGCLNIKTAANTSYIFTDGNGHLQLYPNTAASQYVFIQPDPSGKVAIGNNGNTPYGMLQVGHANTASGSSDGNIVFGKSTGSGYRYFKMGYDADFNFSIGDYGHAAGLVWTQQLKLAYSAPANCIVVASSGNVGMGITTPSTKLQVVGGTTTDSLVVSGAPINTGLRVDSGPASTTYTLPYGAGLYFLYFHYGNPIANYPAAAWQVFYDGFTAAVYTKMFSTNGPQYGQITSASGNVLTISNGGAWWGYDANGVLYVRVSKMC